MVIFLNLTNMQGQTLKLKCILLRKSQRRSEVKLFIQNGQLCSRIMPSLDFSHLRPFSCKNRALLLPEVEKLKP